MSTKTGSFLTCLLAFSIWIKIRLLKQNLNTFISTIKKKKKLSTVFLKIPLEISLLREMMLHNTGSDYTGQIKSSWNRKLSKTVAATENMTIFNNKV